MKLDLKKIINIKNKNDIKKYNLSVPLFNNNYLFHYLIILKNLDGLKIATHPIYKENNDGLNGFHLAAKEYDYDILCFLIKEYTDYIYNKDKYNNSFIYYLPTNEVIKLIKKYPKLDWKDLIENGTPKKNIITKMILSNLNYKDLQEFINIYKLNIIYNDQLLFNIIYNQNINSKNKIELLDHFTIEELNIKTKTNEGIIFSVIELDDNDLFDYLLSKNIDLNYYSIQKSYPIYKALYYHVIENNNLLKSMAYKIYNKLKSVDNFYKQTDKFLDNIAHKILFFRYNNINNNINNNKDYSLDFIILKECDSEIWNQCNINNISPFDLINRLDYKIYSKVFNNIKITKSILERIKKDNINQDWIKLFSSFKEYKEDENNDNITIINNIKYSHSTLFQSRFTDVGIFCLYLTDKYKNLYLPNMDSYLLNNLAFDEITSFPFADDLIIKEPIFPWIINYNTEHTYYIHPYLNNLINAQIKNNNKRFACVFVSIITDTYLHANILIYDFKNKTVERFEPYGNITGTNMLIDEVLEEELTWNTGLRYIKPEEYLPFASFQMISDENNTEYQKAGDFGGFCLAWSIWYLENRLMNPDIGQSILVKKLINKINNLDIKFIEYIRNYANKINESRIKYLTNIGIHKNNISDLNLQHHDDIKLVNYLVNKYSNLI